MLTATDRAAIRARANRLYDLNNACAQHDDTWESESPRVKALHDFMQAHFPAYDVLVLLAEVERLTVLLNEGDRQGDGGEVTPPRPRPATVAELRAMMPAKPPRKLAAQRTVAEVLAAQNRPVEGGCCNRFADNMGCSCLEVAERYEASLAKREPPFIVRQYVNGRWAMAGDYLTIKEAQAGARGCFHNPKIFDRHGIEVVLECEGDA